MIEKALKTTGPVFFCILMILSIPCQVTGIEQKEARTTLIAGIEFVPEILEMIRQSLQRKISRPVSLAYQPLEKDFSQVSRRGSEILLVEDGFATATIPLDYEPTDKEIELVWLMVFGEKFRNISGSMESLAGFGEALLTMKAENAQVYPWFESLYSPNTLLNFNKVFADSGSGKGYKKMDFWRQPDMVKMLYRAMEQGLLNPLSVEADQALAVKVFLAGDAQCFTVWVPAEFLQHPQLARSFFGEVELAAFPGKSVALMPRLSLRLWKTDESEIVWNETHLATSTINFIDGNFDKDQLWKQEKFGPIYDRLIMGDF